MNLTAPQSRLLPLLVLGALGLINFTPTARSQPAPSARREFLIGSLNRLDQLPANRLRTQVEGLPPIAQQRALRWLSSFHFTEQDFPALHADSAGGIFYVCNAAQTEAPAEIEPPPIGAAEVPEVPVSPFPAGLIFHSRPGAPNVLYLNFAGETVTNTQWNSEISRTVIPALPFSADTNFTSFNDTEQAVIKRVWQRMAEDYAPFNIDVTTERPATFSSRTAHALITRNTDANGNPNPYSSAGGVAYVNVFGSTSFATYRPGWIYHNNLGNSDSYIAEAASHEIGHNLGLSHDGKTDGADYYGGHGSGDTSWGPLMGTGYNRNVSQWCKGDYYLANNTQDDLATIAGKISYRTDDHGNTPGAATALIITGGTSVGSTTLENDPTNANPANKGVIERNTDLDVFSFVTGSGPISLAVKPWIAPAETRGGNLDLVLQLYNEAGTRLLTNNPDHLTTALIATNLSEGRYYLYVSNSAVGNPLSSSPTGYTAYASIGQYFISGYVQSAAGFIAPPLAQLQVTDLTQSGQSTKSFSVTYSDDVAIAVATIDSNDIRVTGPNGYDQLAQFVSLNTGGNGTPRTATYALPAPTGTAWAPVHNGTYNIFMRTNQVGDTEGAYVATGQLGQFAVSVPTVIFAASLDTNPGWTLDPQWAYGPPNYGSGGPTAGFTGNNIIGYNLSGDYGNNLSAKYATTPQINCSGNSSVTLRFRRWLRTKVNDTAAIQVSTNGTSWLNVWSTSSAVADSAWQEVQYSLPPNVAGSPTVRLRWSLTSNQSQSEIGWNLDDVELLGDGTIDANPPGPALSVTSITSGGSPSHSCSVTYTDDTAVRLLSLNSTDLVVTGLNGFSNLVEFVGADLPTDGSPITATYSIPAPGGAWDAGDNGTYTLTLLEDAVEDTLNNATPQTVLGTFNVSISAASPGALVVLAAGDLNSSGLVGGPFSPPAISYTLTNSGGSPLNWTASKAQNWITLSATNGPLPAGQTTNVTASLNSNAATLPAGNYSDLISFVNASSGNGNTNRNINLSVMPPPMFQLHLTLNQPAWGTVSPTNGSYPAGTSVQLLATPARYFQFDEWRGDVVSTNNPLPLVLNSNISVLAAFNEILTTNFATPLWWLASYGYTNNVETAVTSLGANGQPLWQSYLAGLNPTDPESQFRLTGQLDADGVSHVLQWNAVTGRVYTIWSATNFLAEFAPLPGATNLAGPIQSFTNSLNGTTPLHFYRIEVQKP